MGENRYGGQHHTPNNCPGFGCPYVEGRYPLLALDWGAISNNGEGMRG